MNPNFVSSGVVNNSFLKDKEFDVLLNEFYALLVINNIKDENKFLLIDKKRNMNKRKKPKTNQNLKSP